MTNLLVKLTLILATNWTSVEVGTQELGYVQTNHVLTVEYQQTTNTFVLLSQPSNIAVYRPKPAADPWQNWGIITNIYSPHYWTPGNEMTNLYHLPDNVFLNTLPSAANCWPPQ